MNKKKGKEGRTSQPVEETVLSAGGIDVGVEVCTFLCPFGGPGLRGNPSWKNYGFLHTTAPLCGFRTDEVREASTDQTSKQIKYQSRYQSTCFGYLLSTYLST